MRERRPVKKFMTEQMELLAANPFTYKINPCRISYTLEFKNLFLAWYETGEGAREIFQSLGYDTALLGDGRIYSFAYRLSRQAEAGEVFTEAHPATKRDRPACVDYNTMPAQQSVAVMQREIAYLRQQLDFLKILPSWTAAKGRGPNHGQAQREIPAHP